VAFGVAGAGIDFALQRVMPRYANYVELNIMLISRHDPFKVGSTTVFSLWPNFGSRIAMGQDGGVP
jgi:hypothetical protein